jgi:LmbE family N-acetylglucosaminyl deacetylase
MTERVLIVAAHPDDEVLGVGGAAARHAAAGDVVSALIVAEGATSRDVRAAGDLEALRDAAHRAAEALGCRGPRFGGLPDNKLDSVPLLDVVKLIEGAVAELDPTIIYTHHQGDLNIDHEVVARAVATACRPLPDSRVKAIFAFETPSSTEWHDSGGLPFRPCHFVDISAFMDAKMAALTHYRREMRPFPHARSVDSVKALAAWRGASVGIAAAEAFSVVRQVSRIR